MLERVCKEVDLIEHIENDINLSALRASGYNGNDIADPLLSELRQHTALLGTLIKQLRLPEQKADASAHATKAVNARWAKRGVA